MQISRALQDELLAAAHAEAPNECCGFIELDGEAAAAYWPIPNDAASPLRFEMNGQALFDAYKEIVLERGLGLAIFHSHTRSAPYPSQTDLNFAEKWPETPWVIAGVAKGASELRAYTIDGSRVEELAVATG